MGVGALAGTDPSDTVAALVASGPPAIYVATRVAVLTAIVVVASPHLARPWRYANRVVIVLGAIAAIGLGRRPTSSVRPPPSPSGSPPPRSRTWCSGRRRGA